MERVYAVQEVHAYLPEAFVQHKPCTIHGHCEPRLAEVGSLLSCHHIRVSRFMMVSKTLRLQAIFAGLCALPTGQELAAFASEYAHLAEELKSSVENGHITSVEMCDIYPYLKYIRVLSQAAIKTESLSSSSRESFQAELNEFLKSHRPDSPGAPRHSTHAHGDDEILNYDVWRQWYSDHVAHPYYDSRERDWLLKQIPGMTPQKMQTWFVNVRRRSGWSELYRKYADNKRENMEAIFAACDDSDPSISNKVAPEARKLVAKIRQYLTLESKKTEVAPWLSDLLDSYKNKSLKKASPAPPSSTAEDEVKPAIISSASSGKHRRNQKRKASDEKTNITPHKRAKPSLYTTPHHPTSSISPPSPSLHDPTTARTKASSATESMGPLQRSMNSSSPDLQTPPTIAYARAENNTEQYTIPPFNAWTPPSQAAYIQPLSAFVPAQAHQVYASMSPQHGSMLQASSGQSFTANNNITYNIAPPMTYSYAQQGPVAVPAQTWNHHHQPQWSYVPVQATSYQLSPTMTSYPSSSYTMLSNLSTTHPGKRKYVPEDDEMPATPTGSYKRGRTSMSMYSEPSMVEVSLILITSNQSCAKVPCLNEKVLYRVELWRWYTSSNLCRAVHVWHKSVRTLHLSHYSNDISIESFCICIEAVLVMISMVIQLEFRILVMLLLLLNLTTYPVFPSLCIV